jgi:hypothetical protein
MIMSRRPSVETVGDAVIQVTLWPSVCNGSAFECVPHHFSLMRLMALSCYRGRMNCVIHIKVLHLHNSFINAATAALPACFRMTVLAVICVMM